MQIKFKCPNCGGHVLEAVYDAVVAHAVTEVNGDELDFSHQTYQEETDFLRFQCEDCGHILENDKGEKVKPEDLEAYLY